MQLGFLDRTPRGRIATDRAFDYFQVPRGIRLGDGQSALF
jgi:Holliday junction DNA helicase RuvB